jgi:hypothetical protein
MAVHTATRTIRRTFREESSVLLPLQALEMGLFVTSRHVFKKDSIFLSSDSLLPKHSRPCAGARSKTIVAPRSQTSYLQTMVLKWKEQFWLDPLHLNLRRIYRWRKFNCWMWNCVQHDAVTPGINNSVVERKCKMSTKKCNSCK